MGPAHDAAARGWHVRIVLVAGWLAFGWMIAERLAAHGMDPAARHILIYALGLGLLAIALEALWRRSRAAVLLAIALWVLWVLGAMGLFWLALVAIGLPLLLKQIQASVDHVLRAPDEAQ